MVVCNYRYRPVSIERVYDGLIRKQISVLPQQSGVKYHGPFVLSLHEFEQLETLMPSRVSELLIDWEAGPHKNEPFKSFYWARTGGVPKENEYVSGSGNEALDRLGDAWVLSEDQEQ